MKSSLQKRLDELSDRFDEITQLLANPEVIADQNRFRDLSKEYARLEPVIREYGVYKKTAEDLTAAEEMIKDKDSEIRSLGAEEAAQTRARLDELDMQIRTQLIPTDPHDESNVYLEIRAGTGGDEAALFAGDLFRMYSRLAEQNGWQVEIVHASQGEHGGYKEIISRVVGKNVYARLKFESGAHRVQRVPETESQGRIHTSACTVAVLPEVDEVEEVKISTQDLRVDTYRASGAGGQHINKTDSAVRLTHLPTGIVVECQDERSQHKNRARAMSLLKARLLAAEREKQEKEQAATRRRLIGSGDRSERIRTYNFPQGRVTDHRINLTLYKLDHIMAGSLDQVIDPLASEYQADQLADFEAKG